MSAFRDMVAADVHAVFLNLDEYGETHTVSGAEVPCVFERIAHTGSRIASNLGAYEADRVLYAAEADVGRRSEGSQLEVDGRFYVVVKWQVDMGMHRVELAMSRPM